MQARLKLLLLIAGTALLAGALWYCQKQRSPQTPATTAPASQPLSTEQSASKAATASSSPIQVRTNLDLETLSPAIRPIVDEQAGYLARLSSARKGMTKLSDADRQGLYAFLLQRSPLDEGQQGHVLKNELLNALCALNPPPAGLGSLLAQMYRDRNQNVVLRDYAVQHLVSFYKQIERVAETERESWRGEQAQARDVLWEALGENDSSIAGTALLGLAQLSEERPQAFDRERIGAAALQLSGQGAGELTRIAALQVSARLGINDARPVLMQTAQQGQSIPLRISAIGALGVLGDAQAVPLLNGFLEGPEERLRLPARRALQQIQLKERQGQAGKTEIN